MTKPDTDAEIQELELRLMRGWLAQDRGELKKLISRDFTCMVGTLPPEMLDRPSFLDAIERGFVLRAFQLRAMFVRHYGRSVWFVAGGELEIDLGLRQWRGEFLITDLWQRGTFGKSWKLAERSIARIEPDDRLAGAVSALQKWR
jgi:hypothetical protein